MLVLHSRACELVEVLGVFVELQDGLAVVELVELVVEQMALILETIRKQGHQIVFEMR